MMKKMFTLFALLACFLGASAEEVVDAEVDFSKYNDISEWNFPNSWGGSESARARLSIQNGYLHFESTEATDPSWDCQFFPIGGVNVEIGTVYTLHYKIKGDHAGNVSMLGFGQTPYGAFSITTSWEEGTVDYEATSSDGNILMQCGDWIGSWDIAYLKITHEKSADERPVTWQEWLTSDGKPVTVESTSAAIPTYMGDAETPWTDPNVRFDDQTQNYLICAWGKEKGINLNDGGGWDPFPATIEAEPGNPSNHVFVVHGKVADTEGNASAWDNQFWIESPKAWKEGEPLFISFRYKASQNVTANTQVHHQNPSDYQFYQAIGDISFTTEWQTFERQVTWPSGAGTDAWSIAFNLNPNVKDAVDFYFDDLSWKSMVLDEGLFVASSNTTTGTAYDYDNAIEFTYDASLQAYVATVGTKGKEDTWVNELMISTVRGYRNSFISNTIKPEGTITGEDPDEWLNYSSASNFKIKLPAAGVWRVSVDTDNLQVLFEKLEGEQNKEPLAEIANPTVNIVKGQEREPTDSEQPADEEAGIAAGTGRAWDNQFFIVANRALAKGEVTILKFKYKSTVADARTTTQCHGEPGGYLHWAAIGDVTFQPEEQEFNQTFTIPDEADGMKSIAFNMAEIKEACDYQIYDVIWMTEDHFETLIDTTGDKNFYVKEGAGTNPYVVSGISSVVNGNKASDNVIYNLAGQRVSKDYKGIVIKNGAKYIAK